MAIKTTLMAAVHQHEHGTDANLFILIHDKYSPQLPTGIDDTRVAELLTIAYDPNEGEELILTDFNNVDSEFMSAIPALPTIRQSQLWG
ncbi:unnamed protein product [Sphagnum jensenii]|uniref:DUF2283 domain-containing protein n=1 Tax=Sphagnum jensenii TaxID=128206 RepID=A0ABP0VBB8_9BRYO